MKNPLAVEMVSQRVRAIGAAIEDENDPMKKAVALVALTELVESTLVCIHLIAESVTPRMDNK